MSAIASVEAGQLEVAGRGRPLSSTDGPTPGFKGILLFVESAPASATRGPRVCRQKTKTAPGSQEPEPPTLPVFSRRSWGHTGSLDSTPRELGFDSAAAASFL